MRSTNRNAALALTGAAGLVLGAAGAQAQTYRVLTGAVTDPSAVEVPLHGGFEASLSPYGEPPPDVLILDDFAFEAGGETLTPAGSIEYGGFVAIPFVRIADQIQVEAGQVSFLHIVAGGEIVDESEGQVTFRTFELRADASDGGQAVGLVGDGPEPRRLHLRGSLFQVDRTYLVPDSCEPPVFPLPPPPPDGGGVVIDGGAIVSYDDFDIDPDETVLFAPGEGSPDPGRVTGGDASVIDGTLETGGSLVILNPVSLDPTGVTARPPTSPLATASLSADAAPTPEELGITAPAGAEVSYQDGALTVTSEGDLVIAGGSWDLPGLVSVTISTPATITVEGELSLPPDVRLLLNAGSVVVEDGGGLESPLPQPAPVPICGLRPLAPVETPAGSFSLVATAAQPAEIDVEPWRRHDRVVLGSRRPVPVALLGSEDLDVRDLDQRSLRLGPGEAAPLFRWVLRLDVNRDHRLDLLGFFRTGDAEIAFGDDLVCMTAEKHDGGLVEGCDAIDTTPHRRR